MLTLICEIERRIDWIVKMLSVMSQPSPRRMELQRELKELKETLELLMK
jgi:hypothetical protein